MTLGDAAEGTPLEGHVLKGKDAIKGEHRNAIATGRGVTGLTSVNLEEAYSAGSPNAPHWDYAVGWQSGGMARCWFIEAHPANTRHVGAMLDKRKATRARLDSDAPAALALAEATRTALRSPVWRWLATGAHVDIHPNMPAARLLATAGIVMPARRLSLR
ncbi:MAG: hypothetical protein FJX72_04680 [Armatimonadetes bacterium]|nr:hypothetical protein [Armatimonadota bacterium]